MGAIQLIVAVVRLSKKSSVLCGLVPGLAEIPCLPIKDDKKKKRKGFCCKLMLSTSTLSKL